MFKNNDITRVREVNDTELILYDGRRMRRDGARIDQGVSITLMQANLVNLIAGSVG